MSDDTSEIRIDVHAAAGDNDAVMVGQSDPINVSVGW
jgi:hypothetical protein